MIIQTDHEASLRELFDLLNCRDPAQKNEIQGECLRLIDNLKRAIALPETESMSDAMKRMDKRIALTRFLIRNIEGGKNNRGLEGTATEGRHMPREAEDNADKDQGFLKLLWEEYWRDRERYENMEKTGTPIEVGKNKVNTIYEGHAVRDLIRGARLLFEKNSGQRAQIRTGNFPDVCDCMLNIAGQPTDGLEDQIERVLDPDVYLRKRNKRKEKRRAKVK